jgi:T1SS-143 domain-containing protein
VVTSDGQTHEITITINGADDPSRISLGDSGSDSGSVTEDVDTDPGTDGIQLTDSGSLTVTDADGGDTPAFDPQATSFNADGSTNADPLGELTIDADGNWNYAVDNGAVQHLGDGDTVTEVYTVVTSDGQTHEITITINGADDPSRISLGDSGSDSGSVTEDVDTDPGTDGIQLTDSGSLTVTDADGGDTPAFDPQATSFNADGSTNADPLGELTIDADGNWNYAVDNGAVQHLGDGDTVTEVYTVVTSDGQTHEITITINGTNDGPVLEDANISLSEEGLSDGIADDAGSVDTTDSTTIIGTMSIEDADGDALNVTLSAPAEDLTSGGQAIVWDGEGTQTLTGYAGDVPVIEISIDNDGAYTVELKGPIDHPADGVEDIHSFGVGVTADDGTTSTTGTLTVHVEDDMPVADSVNTINATAPGDASTNLLIILDNSGSMWSPSGVAGKSRLALAKEAIEDLINAYDDAGNVVVQLVTFSTGSDALGTEWMSASEALGLLNSISAGGMTNYDAALETAMSAFESDGSIDGAQNVSYFLSDGEPTIGDATLGIDTDEQGVWTDFLNENSINSYALGMGTGVSQDSMNPIAHNGVTGMDGTATIVSDLSQLSEVLYSTVNTSVSGELVSADAGADFGFGADGGYIQTLEIDGDTYTFDPGNDTIDVTGSGNTSYTFFDGTSQLLVTTAAGGELTVNMESGSYTYNGPSDQTEDFQEHIEFTLSDNDGDTSSGNLTLQVFADGSGAIELNGTDAIDLIDGTAEADTIDGGAGNDILVGGDGDDLIIGGLDHDTMSGGDGSDTFVFSANGGEGNDTINDFDVATDVIRLSDVLDAEGDNDIDINDLLQDGGQNVSATVSGADVELTISHGGESTVVTLTGINADHSFDGASTLTDLIEHGLQIDIM